MSIKKNNYSVAMVLKGKRVIGYLSNRDIENGRDIQLDIQGYTIISL